jgi:hypothetical protein
MLILCLMNLNRLQRFSLLLWLPLDSSNCFLWFSETF